MNDPGRYHRMWSSRITIPEVIPQEELEEAIKLQAELQEAWAETEAEIARDDRLDLKARECLECGQTARHYRDDYVCFRCRDALETQ